mmetsp:Transcript_16885/g.46388  ORF Transcript_16885/g.46388 Transcript_16885/m.46388 type:complete len:107 (-) Transcript_16885:1969-2289(-)
MHGRVAKRRSASNNSNDNDIEVPFVIDARDADNVIHWFCVATQFSRWFVERERERVERTSTVSRARKGAFEEKKKIMKRSRSNTNCSIKIIVSVFSTRVSDDGIHW